MISFKDMMDSSEKKDNGMQEMKTLSPKVKEEVNKLLEKAKMLLDKDGVADSAEWIKNYCDDMGMDKDVEEDEMPEGDDSEKKSRGALIIEILKKKSGSEEEDEE